MEDKKSFVVLRHFNCPGKEDHLDVLLEGILDREGKPLMKFETPEESNSFTLAQYKDNVRGDYLTYEGPMTGNRGEVKRVESGNWHINRHGEIVFEGERMSGRYNLILRRIE